MLSSRRYGKLLRRAVAAATLSVGFALANAPATARAADLDLTPNPAQANGAEVWMHGCGYAAGKQVGVTIYGPDAVLFFYSGADSNGCLIPSRFWTSSPGDYAVEAAQSSRGKRQIVMGAAYLDVY